MTVSDLITMDGEYAYAHDPFTKVRILCVDAPGGLPVVSIDDTGGICLHYANGQLIPGNSSGCDLVPLQKPRKPVEAWVVVRDDCDRRYFWNKADADDLARHWPGSRLVRLIEAPEDAQ
jgi:hypothetical protein